MPWGGERLGKGGDYPNLDAMAKFTCGGKKKETTGLFGKHKIGES